MNRRTNQLVASKNPQNSGTDQRLFEFACCCVVAISLTACSTARIEQARYAAMNGVADGEAIVVLARRQHSIDEPEPDFVECLNDELKDTDHELSVYPTQDFIDALFPWFEPRTAPANPDGLSRLLEQPGVIKKIESTGVRYLVWVNGDTDEVDQGGGIACTLTPVGAGCFGLKWWEKESIYETAIWDLRSTQSIGQVSADVSGTSYMPAIILPIPMIAQTEDAACEGLVNQLMDLMGLPTD